MERISDVPNRWFDLRPVGIVALAAAMVWSTWIVADTYHSIKVKPVERTIRVTGSAKKRIVSDLIEWSATLESSSMDRTTAYKQLRGYTDRTIEFLKKQGVKPEEIQPQSASFEEVIETTEELKVLPGVKEPVKVEKKTPKGFKTTQVILVRSTDVARIEKASREVTSLLEEGVSITSEAPEYFYTRLGELKVEMLAAAGKDARARADNILKNTGGAKVGSLIAADMGIININPANSTETSEEGNNDRTSLEKDIITIVHASFKLD
ncbi:MAG TPA: SIMPL domain-containing protein [Kofleriaceae bacterium]